MYFVRSLCGLVLLVGCGASTPTTERTERPTPVVESTSERPDPESTSERPDPVESPTVADTASEPTAPPTFGTTEAEAQSMCEETGIEDISVCAFREGGQAVPGGRVDILQVEAYDPTQGLVTSAWLVFRTTAEPELPTTQELASAYAMPGEDSEYRLGELQVDGMKVSIDFTLISQEHPNTGDPNMDPGTITQRDEYTVECELRDGLYECERLDR